MAPEHTTIPLTEPITLQARLGHGSLRVVTREAVTEAAVRLAPRSGDTDLLERFTVELRGSTLVVTGPRQGGLADVLRGRRDARRAVDATIEVPAGTRINLVAATDEIVVTGACGDADVATGAGRISLERVDGDLRLRYGHGDCVVGSVAGALRLRAGSGAVHVAEVGGGFAGQLGRGDVELGVVHGDAHVRNGHGGVHVTAIYGDLDVATGNGGIGVGIPSGVAARVDASTGYGQVVSDLPLDQGPAHGAASIAVRIRTGRGDITLRRAGAAAAA